MTASILRAFLDDPSRPAGTLGYHEVQGFLFTIACAPDLVPPSEWMPIVFGEKDPGYDSIVQANAVPKALMDLYNDTVAVARGPEPRLPDDCPFRADPAANLEPDAPVSQWSRGFTNGHMWLIESWEPYLPEEFSEAFGAVLMALSFFGSKQLAEAFQSEALIDVPTLAADLCRGFPSALAEYASMGRRIEEVLRTVDTRAASKVGRNDPCPCGSGRKYKKCCASAH